MHHSRHGGHDAPAHGDEGYPAGGPETLEDQIAGHFHQDVSGEQSGDGDLILVAHETEVLLESEKTGIADVGSVQEAKEICNHDHWHDMLIDLAHKAFLGLEVDRGPKLDFDLLGGMFLRVSSLRLDLHLG